MIKIYLLLVYYIEPFNMANNYMTTDGNDTI